MNPWYARLRVTSSTDSSSVVWWALIVPGKSMTWAVYPFHRVGSTSILSGISRPAPWAIPVGQTTSTSSGRCGPCCSTLPTGSTHTGRRATAVLTSGQVSFSYRHSVGIRAPGYRFS